MLSEHPASELSEYITPNTAEEWTVVTRPRQIPSGELIVSLFRRAQQVIGSCQIHLIIATEQSAAEQWRNEVERLQFQSTVLILDPEYITAKSKYEAPAYVLYRYIMDRSCLKTLFLGDIYLSFYLHQARKSFARLQKSVIAVAPDNLVAWSASSYTSPQQDVLDVRERMEKECLSHSDAIVTTTNFEIDWIENYIGKKIKGFPIAPLCLDQNTTTQTVTKFVRRFVVEIYNEPSVDFIAAISSCVRVGDQILIVHSGIESGRLVVMKLAAVWGRKVHVKAVSSSELCASTFTDHDVFLFIERNFSLSRLFFTALKMNYKFFIPDCSVYSAIVQDKSRIYHYLAEDLSRLVSDCSHFQKTNLIDDVCCEKLNDWNPKRENPILESQPDMALSKIDITVCICHYDRSEYLKIVLDAVSNQTSKALEIIVVDDGSQLSDSKEFIAELANSKFYAGVPLRVVHTPDVGLGAARNAAATQAAGKYVMFLDDDNIPLPRLLHVLGEAAAVSRADVLTCLSYQYEGFDWLPNANSNIAFLPLGGIEGLGHIFNCFGDANCLIRLQALIDVGGFATTRAPSEDWELFARMTLRGMRVQLVPEVLLAYRANNEQSLTVRTQNDERRFLQISALYRAKYRDLVPTLFSFGRRNHHEHRRQTIRHLQVPVWCDSAQVDLPTMEFRGNWLDISVRLDDKAINATSEIVATVISRACEDIELRFALICESLDMSEQGEFCRWFVFKPGCTIIALPILEMRVERGLPNIARASMLYFGGSASEGSVSAEIVIR